mmetsp:Transcript_51588/g.95472  ORF Transcript_51588/g.95472 Transcript_51588/m.95472 type:complete len:462 (-) Transcript_51588:88-1473(-)
MMLQLDPSCESPRSDEEEEEDRSIDRLRALLTMSVSNKGPVPKWATKRGKADILLQRCKAMFLKHDKWGRGLLELQDMKQLIRHDLKVVERLVSDEQLAMLFEAIDTNCGGRVGFQDFFNFVSQPRKRRHAEEDNAVKDTSRALRLSLHRHKLTLADLEHQFHVYEGMPKDDAPVMLNLFEWRRFFRSIVKVTPHDCSDRNLTYAFHAVDQDGSGKICKEEFIEFLRQSCRKVESRSTPGKVTGLIGGWRDVAPKDRASPRARPKAESQLDGHLPIPQLPLGMSGRDWPATSRMAVATHPSLATSSMWKAAPSTAPRASTSLPRLDGPGGTASASFRGGLGGTGPFLTSLPAQLPPATAPGVMSMSQGLGSTLTSTLSSGTLGSNHSDMRNVRTAPGPLQPSASAGSLSNSLQSGSSTNPLGKPGRYSTIKGGSRLSDIEERLFGAGVDLRGTYHRKKVVE